MAVVAKKLGTHHVMLFYGRVTSRLGEEVFVSKGHQNPSDAELHKIA